MRAPDIDDGLQEGLEEFAEGEEVWDERDGGVEKEPLGRGVGEGREKVEERRGVRFEERGEGTVFLGLSRDADLTRGGLLDGEVVIEDIRDVLEGQDQQLVVDWTGMLALLSSMGSVGLCLEGELAYRRGSL